jgi:non-specific serine/threonine protein kinase
LLDTVRQYGAQRLREAGEEATLRNCHLAWFTAVVEQAEDPLWSPDQVVWFARLKAEEENLRSALEWSTQAPARSDVGGAAIDAGLRLGGALWHYWNLRGHLSEGRARILDLLSTGLGGPSTRAKAFHAAAYLSFLRGDREEASRLADETVAVGRRFVPPFLLASALVGQATNALMQGDAALATTLCEDGLAACREAGDRRGMYYALYGLMEVARTEGDLRRAVDLMEEAHALTREQGDPWSIAFALSILGHLVLLQGDPARAGEIQRESLALRHAIEDGVGIGRCLDGLGWVASAQGQPVRAARLFGAAEALHERVGAAPHLPWRTEHERHVGSAWSRLPEDAFAAAWAEGRALSLERAVAYALEVDEPATVGAPVPARRLHRGRPGGLSPRELEVVHLIVHGLTNRRIAEELVIAEWTVDSHVRHILTKLGFRSRAQVAAWAVEQGLVSPDP